MMLKGDCRELDWGSPDVLITDPPYRPHVHKKGVSQSAKGGARNRDLGFDALSQSLRDWTCGVAARVKRWAIIFSDIESATLWHEGLVLAGATPIRMIPWVRWSMPQLSGDRPPQGAELVIVAYGKERGRKHWNGPGNLTHLAHTCLRGDGKHKAEKPLDLMLDLVDWFSDPGELVVDPFSGSGTTGLACKLLGREFAGAEQDPDWYERARLRINSPLSERDAERAERWRAAQVIAEHDKARRALINKTARYKNRAAQGGEDA
jgi:site-specific DNA-methyltransferase (adenine-specific)